MAAAIRSGVELSDDWKACAVPWKEPSSVIGVLSSACICWIFCTASPSATPGARLNDTVTAGNWPWWLTVSGAVLLVKRATVLIGICAPFEPVTYIRDSAAGSVWNDGRTSSTTLYWVLDV